MPDYLAHDIRIRAGRATDAQALTEVARSAKALWRYQSAWLESWLPQLTVTETDLDRMTVRVAESHQGILAFGALDQVGDEWEIAHLWVVPGFTRRGIGRALLLALIEAAREAGVRRLRIESDPNAESFYASAGATRIGSVPAAMPGAPDRELPLLVLMIDPRDQA